MTGRCPMCDRDGVALLECATTEKALHCANCEETCIDFDAVQVRCSKRGHGLLLYSGDIVQAAGLVGSPQPANEAEWRAAVDDAEIPCPFCSRWGGGTYFLTLDWKGLPHP